jgi:hypothetical protein
VLLAFGVHPLLGIAAAYLAYIGTSWFWLPFTVEELDIGRALLARKVHREQAQ